MRRSSKRSREPCSHAYRRYRPRQASLPARTGGSDHGCRPHPVQSRRPPSGHAALPGRAGVRRRECVACSPHTPPPVSCSGTRISPYSTAGAAALLHSHGRCTSTGAGAAQLTSGRYARLPATHLGPVAVVIALAFSPAVAMLATVAGLLPGLAYGAMVAGAAVSTAWRLRSVRGALPGAGHPPDNPHRVRNRSRPRAGAAPKRCSRHVRLDRTGGGPGEAPSRVVRPEACPAISVPGNWHGGVSHRREPPAWRARPASGGDPQLAGGLSRAS